MSVESSDHAREPENPLKPLRELKEMSFSVLLRKLLKLNNSSRKDLLEYAYTHGYDTINPTTVDRYFNGQRAPRGEKGELFFRVLAEHLELDPEDQELLRLAVKMRRERHIKR